MGAQLADLKFSSDSSTLMGITEPFVRQQGSGYQYELFTWDIVTGRRFPSIKPPTTTVRPQKPIPPSTSNSSNQGFDDTGVSWAIETFAVLATEFSFAAMSKKMIRWGSYDSPEYSIRSRRMADELLDILVTDEEEQVVLVGRPNGRGHVSAFRVSTNKIGGLESLGDGISTGSSHYSRITDCCCLLKKKGKLVMMLANVDNRRGRLYEKYLD